MKVRPFHFGSDYPEICEWWRARKWPFIPKTHLPINGFVVEHDAVKFAVAWVYFTDSAFAWMEWVTTNPQSPIMRRRRALADLVLHCRDVARAQRKDLWTTVQNENLIKLYEECGFEMGDTNMTQLIARHS